jgi:DNA repair exonuclease SbcCD ATPase subunit
MIQPTGYPQPIQLCSRTSHFATLAEMRAYYKGLEETRAKEEEIRAAELETKHWRRIMADLPTESKAGREKRLAALKTDEEERERIIKELKETSDALRKQKTRDTQKRIRQQRSQDKKRWAREADEQRRVETERLAAQEAKVKEVEAKRAEAAQQKEVARRNEVLQKAVETIYKIHRTAFTRAVAATLSTWRAAAKSTTRHAPTCGCCVDKPRRNRKKSTKAPKKPATGDAIAKADAAMAALIAEEEAAARPKLSKKQRKAQEMERLAAEKAHEMERLAAETKRLEEEALAKERALAEAKAAREKEINDDLDRQHQETIRKHRRQAELDRIRRQEVRASEWVVHSDKKDRRSEIKRWRPCRSVELGRPCNRGDACRSAHSLDELTIDRCRFHNCGRIARRPDGTFYNVDNNRPCNYIHEEERRDNYLQRLGMHVFIRGGRERRPASRAR